MSKLIRFIGLVSQSVFLQFMTVLGPVALLISILMGYFRLPSWLVPIAAVIFGVIADKLAGAEVIGVFEKATAADKRGGYLIVVYFIITAVGYVAGAYGRHHYGKKPDSPAAPPPAK